MKRIFPVPNYDEKAKLYRERNKDRINERSRAYRRKRYAENIEFRLACRLRNNINRAMVLQSKAGSAIKDLGCTLSEFKGHISKLFRPGMSWDNHGKWHLDHILPLSKFDLADREQFLKACHYTNMQPLWAKDNLQKHNKVLK